MKNIIEVNGIKLYAFHGCLPEEEKIGGHYIVDLRVETDFTNSFNSDSIRDTVDYVLLNAIVKEEMSIRSKLIEHVGNRIVSRIKKDIGGVYEVQVKISKLTPPINGDVDSVAIIIEG